MSRKEKPLSGYEEARKELLDYLAGSVFPRFLVPPTNVPFSEVFFFSNVARVKRHIVGTPRAAIHMALNNPYYYLEVIEVREDPCCQVTPSLLWGYVGNIASDSDYENDDVEHQLGHELVLPHFFMAFSGSLRPRYFPPLTFSLCCK
jgi:hypothetical protein